jgi:hypothetical protein
MEARREFNKFHSFRLKVRNMGYFIQKPKGINSSGGHLFLTLFKLLMATTSTRFFLLFFLGGGE